MKLRYDFVTNSSSSNFIIIAHDEISSLFEIKKYTNDNAVLAYEYVSKYAHKVLINNEDDIDKNKDILMKHITLYSSLISDKESAKLYESDDYDVVDEKIYNKLKTRIKEELKVGKPLWIYIFSVYDCEYSELEHKTFKLGQEVIRFCNH